MLAAVVIIMVLAVIYFLMEGSYRDRRMSEIAAKVLRQAAQAEEAYFAKEMRYFDADLTGNGSEVFLPGPAGKKEPLQIPPDIVLSLKAGGEDKRHFVGHAFFTGSKFLHRYDSRNGTMTTVERIQEDAG